MISSWMNDFSGVKIGNLGDPVWLRVTQEQTLKCLLKLGLLAKTTTPYCKIFGATKSASFIECAGILAQTTSLPPFTRLAMTTKAFI